MKKKKCLNCKEEIKLESKKFFPFCSVRCKLIDLGEWAFENYKISKPVTNTISEDLKK